MTKTTMVVTALGLILGSPLGAAANDEPDTFMACTFITVRPNSGSGVGARLRFKCPGFYDLPDELGNDPSVEGATLRVFDLGGNAGDDTYTIPPGASWRRTPQNPMSPLRGWRYRADATPTLPCKVLVVRDNVVRATCRHQGVTLTPPFSGDAAVVVTVGTNSKRYCARFGGNTAYNQTRLLWRRHAPAPTECSSPSGAFLEVGAALVE